MTISQSALAVVALAGVVWCGTAVTLPTPPRTGTEPLKPGHCEEYCSRSYPEHTYPQTSDHTACSRGCRLLQLEAYLVYPSRLSSTDTACNDTCAKAYSDRSSLYACQFGCTAPSVAVFEPHQASSSEDVWVLSTLYELVFLQEALKRLDWQAEDLAAQSKEGIVSQHLIVFMSTGEDGGIPDTLKKEVNNSYSGSSYDIAVDDSSASVSTWRVHLGSLTTLWSSRSSNEEGRTEVSPGISVSGCSRHSHKYATNWSTLLDVITVFAVVLLILGIFDLCTSHKHKSRNEPAKSPVLPVFSESDDEKNTKKKPLCVQDSNRYSYVPQEGKFVEGTLTIIRP